jgi:hypothetical protein
LLLLANLFWKWLWFRWRVCIININLKRVDIVLYGIILGLSSTFFFKFIRLSFFLLVLGCRGSAGGFARGQR